jgi:molybdopterin-guanine dinucleotide biosynthesis protein A
MRTEIEPIGVALLAGGKSSRMGCDKALLPFRNMRVTDHMVHLMGVLGCSPIVVSGKVEGYNAIHDILPCAGPVGGIHAIAQKIIQENWPRAWLFVPVDMPLLTPELLNRLSSCLCTYDHDGAHFTDKPLPLFLRLHDHVLSRINQAGEAIAAGGQMAVHRLLETLHICDIPYSDEEALQLANANTPEDWQRILAA